METIVEICCGSYQDAINAYHGGAKRIELNSGLYLGGLTPSLGTLRLIKKNTDLEVICMLRPRGAGFYYSDEDFAVMKEDCHLLLQNGADGIAFGILDEEGCIDFSRCQEIVNIIHHYNKIAVFHRAFDIVPDIEEAMMNLLSLKIDRILTSGLHCKAIDGLDYIQSLQETYGDRIEILAGSGINHTNAKKIIDSTGIHQIHSSCKEWLLDPTTNIADVNFSYHDDEYETVSIELVEELISSVQ